MTRGSEPIDRTLINESTSDQVPDLQMIRLALNQLRKLGEQLPKVDVVAVIRSGRDIESGFKQ